MKIGLDKGARPAGEKIVSTKQRPFMNRSEAMAHLKELSEIERITELFRNYPKYHAPDAFKDIVKKLINSKQYRLFMH